MSLPIDFMNRRLDGLERRGLRRKLTQLEGGAAPWIEIEGRRLLNLSSNNYLGLAGHPDLAAAMATAADDEGCGSGSSRLIAGTSHLHEALESRFAAFKGMESGLLFTSGYTANLGVIPSLVGAGDLVLGDELNHASLIDGCRLSRAEFRSYPHADVGALRDALASTAGGTGTRRRLVVTDTVFSMEGDEAPLTEIAEACSRYDAMLMVDEAHATGCLGPGGRGLVAELQLESQVTASMSTLSKALGGLGALVTGPALLRDYLINTSRSFTFTTALPAPVVAAGLAALDLLERDLWRVQRLQDNAAQLRRGLRDAGFNISGSTTQIVPVLVGESRRALDFAAALRAEGVFAVAVRPPSVPMGAARVRATVMATHSADDIVLAIDAFRRVGASLGMVA
ncbi:MAG: bioF [Chloroflexi bacterium]|nr:bioF [Chloroflexota bacterium]